LTTSSGTDEDLSELSSPEHHDKESEEFIRELMAESAFSVEDEMHQPHYDQITTKYPKPSSSSAKSYKPAGQQR